MGVSCVCEHLNNDTANDITKVIVGTSLSKAQKPS